MDYSFFLTSVAAAIGIFTLFRKLIFDQDTKEKNSSLTPSSSVPPSALTPSSVPPSSLTPLSSLPPSSLTPSSSVPPSALTPSSLVPTSALTPSSSVPPSSSSRIWRHDVFPSFRGEDVRRNFLSHILMEFRRMAITPFIDNEIRRGDSIGPELIRAIQESKIAVILISENYASSKWCLDELVEIMKCREELGQTVLAIFYKVDPSDVKKLTGHFGKVFKKTCGRKTKEAIGRWKQALAQVATIAGYHSSNWDSEAAMIKDIAIDISKILNNSSPSSDFNGLVGMRTHLENMEPLLCLDTDEVRMIGIWGPPGIGKTTIARAAYSQLSNSFQLSVFMDNIKANYTRPCSSDEKSEMLQLQKQFMSQITDHKDMEISHLGVVPDRLKDKKVLVVLDGVDQILQLNAMANKTWWFGPGSRIIITTQDQKLFRAHGINHIYKVDFPSTNEALQIFSTYAFDQKSPTDGFEELAWKVTELVGRLPLGLRVMGSYFRGMSKQDWTESLPKLENSLEGDIQSILKFSYDALDDEDKDLFLHIACFFNSRYKIKELEEFLGEKFSGVKQRLKVLTDKSLISIDQHYSHIQMHSLLVKLGREIVRKQSIRKPGQRQFLVNGKEICKILSSDAAGSENVIGIDFKCEKEELLIRERAFEGMSDLQFVRLVGNHNALNLPRGLNYLSPKLQLLDWSEFPMTCLPSTMTVEFLVELIMQDSRLENLWEGIKRLPSLKRMDLNGSRNLKVLPDFSTATNLEELDLEGCWNLRELPSTIGMAINIVILNLNDCFSMVELPFSIGKLCKLEKLTSQRCSKLEILPTNIDLQSLQHIDFTDCSKLKMFPEISTKVINLFLGGTAIEEVPPSIKSWSRLEVFFMTRCENLKCIPQMNLNDTKIQEVPPISRLEVLNFMQCRQLVSIPQFLPLGNLIDMHLNFCVNLKELPDLSTAINISQMILNDCSSLVELPVSIGNLRKLQSLSLQRCSKLQILPTNIDLESLQDVDFTDCSMLKMFPEISTKVRNLNLKGTRIEEVPLSIGSWPLLSELSMSYFENLKEFPHAFDVITKLYFSDTEVREVPPWIKKMSRLKFLVLERCRKLVSLPQIPDSLYEINAEGCKSLERLDMDLSNATKLRKLNLDNCSSLTKLPSSVVDAANLGQLNLRNCSNLVELPLSIGNLQSLILKGCSNLVELSSSSVNATIKLEGLDLTNCWSLRKLSSSIGNATNLKELNLSGCSSLVELPVFIGNLQNLSRLRLKGCTKLEVLPTNINLKSLYKLDLTDCSMLKSFPEISTNIEELCLQRTAIEEVPVSIKTWSCPRHFNMSYFENLKEFPHALHIITELYFSDTEIQEIPPLVMRFSRLFALVLDGCRHLVSLPQFPDSLSCIYAKDCESLERLDCFFHNPMACLDFSKCFKLNQEARDLIIQAPLHLRSYSFVVPGREVPSYFTHRATCGECSMTIKLNDNPLPKFTRFKACIWLLYKGDDTDWKARGSISIKCERRECFKDKVLREHLYIFGVESVVTFSELVLDFSFAKDNDMWEIGEFGLLELS